MSSQRQSKTVSTETQNWSQILSENERWIRQVLKNRLLNTDEVDEVYQEIGLSLLRSTSSLEEIENPSAWLYRVTLRQVLMYRRKTGRYRKLLQNTVADRETKTTPIENPLALLMRTERTETIRQTLQQLHETDREILMLKYSENWTYKQLAEKLGVSTHTIEHRLVKAKKALRKLFTNSDGEVKV